MTIKPPNYKGYGNTIATYCKFMKERNSVIQSKATAKKLKVASFTLEELNRDVAEKNC